MKEIVKYIPETLDECCELNCRDCHHSCNDNTYWSHKDGCTLMNKLIERRIDNVNSKGM